MTPTPDVTTADSDEEASWQCPYCKSNAYAGGVYHWHGCTYDPAADIAQALADQAAAIHARYEALEQAWAARAARIRRDLPPAGEVPADVRAAWSLEAGAWGLAAVELNDLRNGTQR